MKEVSISRTPAVIILAAFYLSNRLSCPLPHKHPLKVKRGSGFFHSRQPQLQIYNVIKGSQENGLALHVIRERTIGGQRRILVDVFTFNLDTARHERGEKSQSQRRNVLTQ